MSYPASSYHLAFVESAVDDRFYRRGHFDSNNIREFIDTKTGTLVRVNEHNANCTGFQLTSLQRSHQFFAPSWAVLRLFELTANSGFAWNCVADAALMRKHTVDECTINNLLVNTQDPSVIHQFNDELLATTLDASAEPFNSFASILDQTSQLTQTSLLSYHFNVSIFFASINQLEFDGRTPVRVKITGHKCNESVVTCTPDAGDLFVVNIDWLLVRPFREREALTTPSHCSGSMLPYQPNLPQSVSPQSLIPGLPKLYATLPHIPVSFHSTILFSSLTTNVSNDVQLHSSNASLEWTRYHPYGEVLRSVSVNETGFTSDNYILWNMTRGGSTYNVTNNQCIIQRSAWNPISNWRAESFPSFLSEAESIRPDRMWMLMRKWQYIGLSKIDDEPVLHYRTFDSQFWSWPTSHTWWFYNTSVFIRPFGWQTSTGNTVHANQSWPVQWLNVGKESVQPLHRCRGPNCTLPEAERSFADSWTFYGFAPGVPLMPEVSQMTVNCSKTIKPALFPPLPPAYTSTVVVSSTLTSQTYGYTEYVDKERGKVRFDGRYLDDETVEIFEYGRTNTSTSFVNKAHDQGAMGYGSRPNIVTAPFDLTKDTTVGSGRPCTTYVLNSTQRQDLEQWLEPAYLYYVNRYPFSQWTHNSFDTLYGEQVDQWTVQMQAEDDEGNGFFDTAILYFSWPTSIADPQVPLRFEFNRVMYNVSLNNEAVMIESTVVDFIQWQELPIGKNKVEQSMFRVFPESTCQTDTLAERYPGLVSAVAAPSMFGMSELAMMMPVLPRSFSALIITPLRIEDGDSTLYAVRWYVDRINGNERIDWAPLSSRDESYPTNARTQINRNVTNAGTYEIVQNRRTSMSQNETACTTTHRQPSILDGMLSGSLPRLFSRGLQAPITTSLDVWNGINVICFTGMPNVGLIHNSANTNHPNNGYQVSTQACFSRPGWTELGRTGDNEANQMSLVMVRDVYMKGTSSQVRVVPYSFAMYDASQPSMHLFLLEKSGCTPSGIHKSQSDADVADADMEMEIIAFAVIAALSVVTLVVLAVLRWKHVKNTTSLPEEEEVPQSPVMDSRFASLGSPSKLSELDAAAFDHVVDDVAFSFAHSSSQSSSSQSSFDRLKAKVEMSSLGRYLFQQDAQFASSSIDSRSLMYENR